MFKWEIEKHEKLAQPVEAINTTTTIILVLAGTPV